MTQHHAPTVTSNIYLDMLQLYAVPHFPEGVNFQQDGAPPHYGNIVQMNIIEDIRDALLHAVEKRSPPPRTPLDFLTALQNSWCEFPPECRQTPVEFMPRRFASLLHARGGSARY
ncbi:hypothetical protein AVEN_254720-1 [Araneus ventricosus]|uniref:Tc1-like transposase DDE domain-containing protein n=1 Tax=Araneus ventricosus TaxID=182803 RepID=A0A4Y2XCI3_ARAVE|nr:hypothetical protein AVEN_11770-1 [Araneus ventricosus]GBL53508.1 hypothetical protein AVEN_21058-1 [Araneus ventricosus]GBO45642.1 hypothetical protein AVEN_247868-1 [Araneus ventricosus]GBO45644.1 hypothetical protein AVEN_254720-1 [Araneus ventricosus]